METIGHGGLGPWRKIGIFGCPSHSDQAANNVFGSFTLKIAMYSFFHRPRSGAGVCFQSRLSSTGGGGT